MQQWPFRSKGFIPLPLTTINMVVLGCLGASFMSQHLQQAKSHHHPTTTVKASILNNCQWISLQEL
jgi:hypothetical protein